MQETLRGTKQQTFFKEMQWEYEIYEISTSFSTLIGFIMNKQLMDQKLHESRLVRSDDPGRYLDEQSASDVSNDDIALSLMFAGFTRDAIISAAGIYKQQMIVVIVTLIEGMMSDFINVIFTAFPAKMYEYVGVDTKNPQKGKVDLNEIIKSETKESLITALTKRASRVLMQGKFESSLKALERLCGNTLENQVFQSLVDLNVKRNRIVHEHSGGALSTIDIGNAFNLTKAFLGFMAHSAHKLGISTDELSEVRETLQKDDSPSIIENQNADDIS